MTDEMKARCQFALALVDSIWLKGKISDEERLKARMIIIQKIARAAADEEALKNGKK